jgi:glycerate kinase
MAARILIAPDKFKGTLSAPAAAAAIARGWHRHRPDDQLDLLPIGDGGDGFGEILSRGLQAEARQVRTLDAAHRPVIGNWWWEPRTRTAIIESAKTIGLALLPPGEFHPFELDTFGLGAVLEAAAAEGARHCILGIGGSATNDGGTGLARALGWQFLDAGGDAISAWTDMGALASVVPPRRRRPFARLTVAVDVRNPLLGAHGCTRVYGPQKGLRPEDFALAEKALRRLARVTRQQLGRLTASQPGAGAAGGLGFGLMTFQGARLTPGFALFARQAGLAHHLRQADLVITGEGALDASSLMGKGVGELARLCQSARIPCMALAGTVLQPEKARRRFRHVAGLVELAGAEAAHAQAAYWLEELAARTAADPEFELS